MYNLSTVCDVDTDAKEVEDEVLDASVSQDLLYPSVEMVAREEARQRKCEVAEFVGDACHIGRHLPDIALDLS